MTVEQIVSIGSTEGDRRMTEDWIVVVVRREWHRHWPAGATRSEYRMRLSRATTLTIINERACVRTNGNGKLYVWWLHFRDREDPLCVAFTARARGHPEPERTDYEGCESRRYVKLGLRQVRLG